MEFEHWRPLISNLIGVLMLVVFLMFDAFQNALSAKAFLCVQTIRLQVLSC